MAAADQLLRGINAALGNQRVSECADADFDRDGRVTVDEFVTAVLAVVVGCVS